VTLVTPSYQQAPFLEQTILSVLNQGYPDLEYFVFDGGSTDGSVEIIRRYTDHLAGWESQPDRGQSHAVNKGWKLATGSYLWWLNSDDMLTPGSLFRSVRYLEEHPQSGMVYGDLIIVDATGKVTGRNRYKDFTYRQVLRTGQDISQAGAMMRRNCLEQVGFLNEGFHLVMDLEYWHRLALAGIQIDHLDDTLALFRVYDETKTQSSPADFIPERLRVASMITSHPTFQSHYADLESTVWSHAHAASARGYAKAGEFLHGLGECWKSLRFNPSRLVDRGWWYLNLLNVAGLIMGRDRWLRMRANTRARRAARDSESVET
jgi:glycosyltransferase involved in cell wall biosynthesis